MGNVNVTFNSPSEVPSVVNTVSTNLTVSGVAKGGFFGFYGVHIGVVPFTDDTFLKFDENKSKFSKPLDDLTIGNSNSPPFSGNFTVEPNTNYMIFAYKNSNGNVSKLLFVKSLGNSGEDAVIFQDPEGFSPIQPANTHTTSHVPHHVSLTNHVFHGVPSIIQVFPPAFPTSSVVFHGFSNDGTSNPSTTLTTPEGTYALSSPGTIMFTSNSTHEGVVSDIFFHVTIPNPFVNTNIDSTSSSPLDIYLSQFANSSLPTINLAIVLPRITVGYRGPTKTLCGVNAVIDVTSEGVIEGGSPPFDLSSLKFLSPRATRNGTRLNVSGQGNYSIHPNGTIVFSPDCSFVGLATPVSFQILKEVDEQNTVPFTGTVQVLVVACDDDCDRKPHPKQDYQVESQQSDDLQSSRGAHKTQSSSDCDDLQRKTERSQRSQRSQSVHSRRHVDYSPPCEEKCKKPCNKECSSTLIYLVMVVAVVAILVLGALLVYGGYGKNKMIVGAGVAAVALLLLVRYCSRC